MSQLVKIATVEEIPAGKGTCVEVDGKRIAVWHVDGGYYAIDENCPHAGGPLSEGELDGKEVVCPWHGASFNLEDGAVTNGPAKVGVRHYPVKVEGNEIKIEV